MKLLLQLLTFIHMIPAYICRRALRRRMASLCPADLLLPLLRLSAQWQQGPFFPFFLFFFKLFFNFWICGPWFSSFRINRELIWKYRILGPISKLLTQGAFTKIPRFQGTTRQGGEAPCQLSALMLPYESVQKIFYCVTVSMLINLRSSAY